MPNEPSVYTLYGTFKPYVRMTQRGKWVRPEAQEYLASKADLARQFQCARLDMLPAQTPLAVSIVIEHKHGFHNRDLDNEVKAILDAAQGIVFVDDRWVDQIYAQRHRGQTDRIFVTVEALA